MNQIVKVKRNILWTINVFFCSDSCLVMVAFTYLTYIFFTFRCVKVKRKSTFDFFFLT